MSIRKPIFAVIAALGVGLGGCMQSTLEPASEASMKPRDKELLAQSLAEFYREMDAQKEMSKISTYWKLCEKVQRTTCQVLEQQ